MSMLLHVYTGFATPQGRGEIGFSLLVCSLSKMYTTTIPGSPVHMFEVVHVEPDCNLGQQQLEVARDRVRLVLPGTPNCIVDKGVAALETCFCCLYLLEQDSRVVPRRGGCDKASG